MYLMDFDGTLVGSDNWGGWINNAKLCLKQLHFNPSTLDIRWAILTARPKIDIPFIRYICSRHKLFPTQIFTSPTFLYKFESSDHESKYKEEVIKGILDEKIKVNHTSSKIDKVFYLDNNEKITIPLNRNRNNYRYLAISVPDFLTKNYYEVIL